MRSGRERATTTQKIKFRKCSHASSVTILGTHVLRIHQRRKFDSRCLLNQAASTAVNITGEASENVCVAVRDRLAAKRLLQTEVQASKQLNLPIYLDQCTSGAYQVLMGF